MTKTGIYPEGTKLRRGWSDFKFNIGFGFLAPENAWVHKISVKGTRKWLKPLNALKAYNFDVGGPISNLTTDS
ncbi:hypothetical protein Ddc_07454 [Ditylenchus destructor]|nr:hypothetical protein Ddc_07454 [Ditylenchus destructor]